MRALRLLRDERGQSVVELALVIPILCMILFATVELGRAFDATHALAGLTREGANLASRGTELDEVLDVVLDNGADIALRTRGGVIASRLVVEDDELVVETQNASDGYALRSRIGQPGEAADGFDEITLVSGQSLYVVEVFYPFDAVTPLENLVRWTLPQELYERAVF